MAKIRSASLSLVLGLFFSFGPVLADEGFYMWNGKHVTKEFAQAVTLINKAANNLNSGKIEEGCEQSQEACRLAPEFAMAHGTYGAALARAGKNEQAIEECRKSISLDGNDAETWITLGAVLQSSGKALEAIDTLHQYQARFPNDSHQTMIANELIMLEAEAKRRLPASEESADDYFADTVSRAGTLKWEAQRMPIKVLIENGDSVMGYKRDYGTIVKDAFEQWAAVGKGKISFQFLNSDSQTRPDIRVVWRVDSSELSQKAEGGEAQVMPGSDGISEVTIKLLTISPLKTMPMTDGMMKFTATHEIGHSLGLVGHSPVAGDIMYASIPLNFEHVCISQRDARTLVKLYSDDVRCSNMNEVAKSMGITPNLAPGQFLAGRDELDIDEDAKKCGNAGDYATAAEKYKVGLARFPKSGLLQHNYIAAISNCGKQQLDAHNFEKASELFKAGLAIDPNNQTLVLNYGVTEMNWANQYARDGNFQRAEPLYIESLRAFKFNNTRQDMIALVTQNYASMLKHLGRNSEAAQIEAQAGH